MSDSPVYEAARAVAAESPESAGLLAQIMESNHAMTLSMLPTWDQFEQVKERSYQRGFEEGFALARERAMARLEYDLFGEGPSWKDET